jgi:hypothetical protein
MMISLLAVPSCKKDNLTQPNSRTISDVILPLAAGNTWRYQGQLIDTTGNVVHTDTVAMNAMGPDTIRSVYGYWIQGSIFGFIQYNGLSNRSDGLYAQSLYEPPTYSRALPFPTFIGDTVRYGYWLVKTKTLDQTVSVSAGIFTCIEYDVYDASNHNLLLEMFCSSNVGLVKLLPFNNFPSAEYQLISYKLY